VFLIPIFSSWRRYEEGSRVTSVRGSLSTSGDYETEFCLPDVGFSAQRRADDSIN